MSCCVLCTVNLIGLFSYIYIYIYRTSILIEREEYADGIDLIDEKDIYADRVVYGVFGTTYIRINFNLIMIFLRAMV